ncbi:hypothetical protein FMZ60_08820 [Alcaligenaceae bacterium SJ-26]|nr:hypothetical protein FMZ60_08820 [Alcaligenaceae bacterium SJ-26]
MSIGSVVIPAWLRYGAAALLAAGAAWTAQGWRYGERIALIERDQAQAQATAARLSLDQLLADIDTVAAAGRRAAAVGPSLTAEINKLTGALKNAPPLPDGCRPDPVRVRSLTDAVRAANRAAAGQQPGATMPAAP